MTEFLRIVFITISHNICVISNSALLYRISCGSSRSLEDDKWGFSLNKIRADRCHVSCKLLIRAWPVPGEIRYIETVIANQIWPHDTLNLVSSMKIVRNDMVTWSINLPAYINCALVANILFPPIIPRFILRDWLPIMARAHSTTVLLICALVIAMFLATVGRAQCTKSGVPCNRNR